MHSTLNCVLRKIDMERFFATFTRYDFAENKICGEEYCICEVSLPVSLLLIDHSILNHVLLVSSPFLTLQIHILLKR